LLALVLQTQKWNLRARASAMRAAFVCLTHFVPPV
jgi:hypothetical protein